MKRLTAQHFHATKMMLAMAVLAVLCIASAVAKNENIAVSNSVSAYAELASVPSNARARRNPLADDPDAVAAGKKLFERYCAECHGGIAQGGNRAPSLRADAVRRARPGALFWILSNGVVRRGMPDWSKLPEPQRWQIVTFLKSLPPLAAPPALSGSR